MIDTIIRYTSGIEKEAHSMNYVLLISHGTLAEAMHNTLKAFFVGDRPDLLHVCMEEGMSPDQYAENVTRILSKVTENDKLTVLADLMGGSPLTYASYVINEMGLLDETTFLCGMNLPMIVELLTGKEQPAVHVQRHSFLEEARNTIRPFVLPPLETLCTAEAI